MDSRDSSAQKWTEAYLLMLTEGRLSVHGDKCPGPHTKHAGQRPHCDQSGDGHTERRQEVLGRGWPQGGSRRRRSRKTACSGTKLQTPRETCNTAWTPKSNPNFHRETVCCDQAVPRFQLLNTYSSCPPLSPEYQATL